MKQLESRFDEFCLTEEPNISSEEDESPMSRARASTVSSNPPSSDSKIRLTDLEKNENNISKSGDRVASSLRENVDSAIGDYGAPSLDQSGDSLASTTKGNHAEPVLRTRQPMMATSVCDRARSGAGPVHVPIGARPKSGKILLRKNTPACLPKVETLYGGWGILLL